MATPSPELSEAITHAMADCFARWRQEEKSREDAETLFSTYVAKIEAVVTVKPGLPAAVHVVLKDRRPGREAVESYAIEIRDGQAKLRRARN